MRKLVLCIIGIFTSFIGAACLLLLSDPISIEGQFDYGYWVPIYGLLDVAILFSILLNLHVRREPTPTKRRRVRVKSVVPATSSITGEQPSEELSLD
jgi:hypothetical protein